MMEWCDWKNAIWNYSLCHMQPVCVKTKMPMEISISKFMTDPLWNAMKLSKDFVRYGEARCQWLKFCCRRPLCCDASTIAGVLASLPKYRIQQLKSILNCTTWIAANLPKFSQRSCAGFRTENRITFKILMRRALIVGVTPDYRELCIPFSSQPSWRLLRSVAPVPPTIL